MGLFFRKTKVKLMAPVTGMVIPLEQVPDQAFAQKMLGDGVAVRKKENWWLPVTEKSPMCRIRPMPLP